MKAESKVRRLSVGDAEDLVTGAVRSLVRDVEGAELVSRQFQMMVDFAQSVMGTEDSNAQVTFSRVEVTAWPEDDESGETGSTVVAAGRRQPIDWGPKRRKPIRTGGGSCWTITIAGVKITICVEY